MKACKKCGSTEFNKSGQCKPCASLRYAAWRLVNKAKLKADNAAWSAANKDGVRARKAAWYEENKDKVSAWNEANKDKIRASSAARYKANSYKIRLKVTAYRDANHEKVAERQAAWQKANPDKMRIYNLNKIARRRTAVGSLSHGLSDKLFKLQNGKCACCGEPLGTNYHLDHIMPLALGGTNTDDNIQLLKATCNRQKHAKHPIDFMQSRGFLC